MTQPGPDEPPECSEIGTLYDEEGVEVVCDRYHGHKGWHFDPVIGWWGEND